MRTRTAPNDETRERATTSALMVGLVLLMMLGEAIIPWLAGRLPW